MRGVGVMISRTAGNSETIYAQLTTDAKGRYTSPGLWCGYSYEVDAERAGYQQRIDAPVTPIDGQPLAARDIIMDKADAWVAGRVIDANGKPIKGAAVSSLDGSDWATTNASGWFRFGGLVDGSVLLKVTTAKGAGAFAELMSRTRDGVVQLDAPQPRGSRDNQPLGL